MGFPGGNKYPKGFNGFRSANVMTAVTVEKVDPDKPVRTWKKAPQEFHGIIDYGKLRLAAGSLVSPVVRIEVDEANQKVSFTHERLLLESVDSFLDDKIYGVLLHEPERFCHVAELGARGETFETSMDLTKDVKVDGLIVYVFAVRVDGKDTSDSVCLRVPEA